MGRGDQRSRRGKIVRGTYGATRPRKKKIPLVQKAGKPSKKVEGKTKE